MIYSNRRPMMKLLFMVIALQLGQAAGARDDSLKMAIASPEEAKFAALESTGFKNLSDSQIVIGAQGTFILKDTSSAFSADYLNGKTVWRILIENAQLNLARFPSDISRQYPKNFDIIIDAQTGFPLEIKAAPSGENSIKSDASSPNEALRPFGLLGENFLGLPLIPPSITFLQALENCKCQPLIAERMMAAYVLYSYDYSAFGQSTPDTAEFPAWVIYLDGLPRWSPNGLTDGYTNQKVVVNAITGERVLGPFSYGRSSEKEGSKSDKK